MDLVRSRELLHRINLLCSRGVISADTRVRLHEILCERQAEEAEVATPLLPAPHMTPFHESQWHDGSCHVDS